MRAWFKAAQQDNLGYIQQNVKQFCGQTDSDGKTALMVAVLAKSQTVAEYLAALEYGLQTKQEGITALMLAAGTGNEEMVDILKEKEAKMQSHSGQTALMCAAVNNYPNCCKKLRNEQKMQNEKGETALILAAAQGNLDVVKLLIKREFSIVDS